MTEGYNVGYYSRKMKVNVYVCICMYLKYKMRCNMS